MTHTFKEFSTNAIFNIGNEHDLQSFKQAKQCEFYTFIWAKSEPIDLIIDSIPFTLEPHSILALTPIQYLQYKSGQHVTMYQFNQEFYCIKDHDQEVSCVGILFFGNINIPVIHLNTLEQEKFETLHDVFIDELETEDNIQAEMLRMLMARFIIKSTRLLKAKEGFIETPKSSKVDLLREFNFLVEQHFKTEHSVTFYAEKLYKSPKTLSNNFAKLNRSPLQIIHERIVLEAQRLLIYTDKTAKEIAYDIGFEDASHLSRLFKKHTSYSPSDYKKRLNTSS
ncbi:AraC family transcriptional regulator [Formosa algae]|uniref:AraC-like DNA-binding protein n=1 Tax=Formosa algae TaxID=225843 RepID=A0A9X1CDG6_9FLAO|nr:helix-turn-helix domain-containing protein [Formosa algae]MBP1841280.1 AraC-like DNA-binding protein [Formosa algae]MDQ0336797.1 AraC-like DNA-binding protein [Formosa algae]OEI80569.1 AraC family transcriptional regulator [Formosa algae]PNW28450.1 AraC family transcriptional regulator [Formosa algae]